jgi:hypothetical protein
MKVVDVKKTYILYRTGRDSFNNYVNITYIFIIYVNAKFNLSHAVSPEGRAVEKLGNDKRCFSWKENLVKIANCSVTCLGSSLDKLILTLLPFLLHV